MTTQNHEASPSGSEEQLDQAKIIEETGGVRPQNARHLIHCLSVIGQIEGHSNLPEDTKTTKYEHILPALVAIEQDRSIEGLLILLNTMGGDVEAGLAIAEMIAGMRTPTVSLVLGGGHSIGIPLAVSADLSMIVPSASMTVHPVRTSGLVLGVPQTTRYFEKNTGAHHRLSPPAQPRHRGRFAPDDDEHAGDGDRYGHSSLRKGGRCLRTHRPHRLAARGH